MRSRIRDPGLRHGGIGSRWVPSQSPDPVLQELARQSLTVLRTLNDADLLADPLRQLASILRIFAAHSQATKLDIAFMTALREMRSWELRGVSPNRIGVGRALQRLDREHGLRVDVKRLGIPLEDSAHWQDAYAQYLKRGAVPTWLAVAGTIERATDRRPARRSIRQPSADRITTHLVEHVLKMALATACTFLTRHWPICIIVTVDYIAWVRFRATAMHEQVD
jgi:hypothetical protein